MLVVKRELSMKHRDIEFDIKEIEPHKWGWTIYQKIEKGPKVVGETRYRSREQAVAACKKEIGRALDGEERDSVD